MPLNHREIISVLQQVCEQKGMKATMVGVVKGTCTVAALAVAGGLVGGPMGMGIGGTIGSVVASRSGRGKFKSVTKIIMCDMTDEQRRKLARSIQDIIWDIDADDVMMAVAMIMANGSLQRLLFAAVGKYLKSEMGLKLL